VSGSSQEQVSCQVKLVPVSRTRSHVASQVVKETKRWIACAADVEGRGARTVYALRRTVATIVVAMPEWVSTLQKSAKTGKESLACLIEEQPCLASTAARMARQLVVQTQSLHSEMIAHLCLGPPDVGVDQHGGLLLGDFLGKIRLLHVMQGKGNGDENLEDSWWMWYPAEVLLGSRNGSLTKDLNIDGFQDGSRVDAWQLGLTVFFLLTGLHPFGDLSDPATVCRNILTDNRVHFAELAHVPLFSDLIDRFLTRRPELRLLPSGALRHPVFWLLPEAARFASSPLVSSKESWCDPVVGRWISSLPVLSLLSSSKAVTSHVTFSELTSLISSTALSMKESDTAEAESAVQDELDTAWGGTSMLLGADRGLPCALMPPPGLALIPPPPGLEDIVPARTLPPHSYDDTPTYIDTVASGTSPSLAQDDVKSVELTRTPSPKGFLPHLRASSSSPTTRSTHTLGSATEPGSLEVFPNAWQMLTGEGMCEEISLPFLASAQLSNSHDFFRQLPSFSDVAVARSQSVLEAQKSFLVDEHLAVRARQNLVHQLEHLKQLHKLHQLQWSANEHYVQRLHRQAPGFPVSLIVPHTPQPAQTLQIGLGVEQ